MRIESVFLAACFLACCFFSYKSPILLSPFITFNSSLLGITISSFSFFLIFESKSKWHVALLFILVAGINAWLASRAGFLVFLSGVFVHGFCGGFFKQISKKWMFGVISLSVLLGSFLVLFIKSDSTSGRWFIWKNCFRLIQDHPLTGTGWGSYRVAYNDMQAHYFQANGFQGKEALLADTVYYAFNEWLQLAVELGVPVSLTLFGLNMLLVLAVIKRIRDGERNRFVTGAITSFTSLLTATFISYPFYYLPTIVLYLFLVLYLLYFLMQQYFSKKSILTLSAFSFLLIGWVVYKQVVARKYWNDATELSRISYNLKAKSMLLKAYPVLHSNGDYLYSLAMAYSNVNQKDSAIYFLNQSLFYKNDYQLHRKMGQLYYEHGDVGTAEFHFLKSVYIVPNRFKSREMLVDFYIRCRQAEKAREWAKSSFSFPVKVPSVQVFHIKQRFEQYLQTGEW